jgi:hypothetical protein
MARPRLRALFAIPLMLVAFTLGGRGVHRAMADPLIRHGHAATATIGATGTGPQGQRWARVSFATATGPVTTMIAVCHHQAYEVGGTVPIVYDTAQPAHAGERHMYPTFAQALAAPAVLLLLGLGLALALVRRVRRRVPEPPLAPALSRQLVEPEVEPVPVPVRPVGPAGPETAAEYLEDVLVNA